MRISRSILVVLASGLATVPAASGAFTGNTFIVQASNSQGSGQVVIPLADGVVNGITGSFTYVLAAPIQITNGSGDVIGTITSLTEAALSDPRINLGFAVLAGSLDTTFTITTGLLQFPTINPAQGRASGSITVTDGNGDGASLSNSNGPIWDWKFNGQAPGGTTFAGLLNGVYGAGMDESNAFPQNQGTIPIGSAVNDMSGQVRFTLSANDLASGTGTFVVVPDPGTLSVLGLTMVTAVRRRRR